MTQPRYPGATRGSSTQWNAGAVRARRDRVDELGTDEEAPVDVKAEIAGHPRAGAVRADDEPGPHRLRARRTGRRPPTRRRTARPSRTRAPADSAARRACS